MNQVGWPKKLSQLERRANKLSENSQNLVRNIWKPKPFEPRIVKGRSLKIVLFCAFSIFNYV